MDNLITSDGDLVIILSSPAIVHPNYNYYNYDQGRVFVVTQTTSEWSVTKVVPTSDRYILFNV